MIDLRSRERLLQEKKQKDIQVLYADSLMQKKTNEILLSELLKSNKETQAYLDKLARALLVIYKKIPTEFNLPEKQQVEGDVIISSLPSVEINNFEELTQHLQNQEQTIRDLTETLKSFQKELPFLDIPDIDSKEFDFPDPIQEDHSDIIRELGKIKEAVENSQAVAPQDNTILLTGLGRIESGLLNLKEAVLQARNVTVKPTKQIIPMVDTASIVTAIKEIDIPPPQSNEDVLDALYRVEQGIAALVNRPQMTTPPVTNININALEGSVLTSQIQLGSTVTPMPAIALANRRALQIYNNGGSTIYLGGKNVSISNGIPVTPGAYSDIFDAGINLTIYGISQSGQNNDCRVLEISNVNIGT